MKIVNKYLLIAIAVFSFFSFIHQKPEPEWDKMTSFRMYAFNFAKPMSQLTDSELDTLVSLDVPVNEMKDIFKNGIKITEQGLLYNTMIFCILKFKDAPDRRFIISSHNGFFTDMHGGRQYTVLPEYRKRWDKAIAKYERILIRKDYLKAHPDSDTTQWYRGDIEN